MPQYITFTATESDSFKVEIWNYSTNTFVTDVPLSTPFDASPYVGNPSEPWLPIPNNEYRVTPLNDATILAIAPTPSNYTPAFTESVGYWQGRPILDGYYSGDISVTVTAQGGGVVTASTYNRVYKVDADIIQNFSDIVARPPGSEINLSDYVVTLLSIPFEIPSEFVGVEAPIVLGAVVTTVEAPVLSTDLLPISLGEIEVSGFAGNSLDYVATDYTLVLPYVADEIALEPQWVVGEKLSVQYVLDAYSGNLTINVFSTSQDDPIHTSKSSLGRVIPFKMFGDKMDSSTGSIQGVDNGVLSAYVRAQRKVLTGGEFSNLVTLEAELGDLKGFVSVENIELVCNGTASEKQEIINQLRNGVYIK